MYLLFVLGRESEVYALRSKNTPASMWWVYGFPGLITSI
ncbi:hypothetical protein VCR20J5_1390052 [Vibrio crassostreae]|nr:hypothetical protein VCR20J5_1390052 [Vibrio crassostreae]